MSRFRVRLTPRGGRDAVDGWARDADGGLFLKVRVSAAPVDGGANAALIALLAKTLRRPRSAVRIASGAASRIKTVEVDGLAPADLEVAFGSPKGTIAGG